MYASDDIRGVFDIAVSAVAEMQRVAKRQEAQRELRSLSAPPTRCGDCALWMKSRLCPKERNVNGYSRGPSMSAWKCSKFAESTSSQDHRARRTTEIETLLAPSADGSSNE